MTPNVPAIVALPAPRGRLSAWTIDALERPADRDVPEPPPVEDDGLSGEDLHLALYLAYEVHYRSLDGVDDRWEWHPSLLAFRASLERSFESALHDAVATMPGVPAGPIDERLRDVLRSDAGPSLSSYLQRAGTIDQYREFLMHRSAYQLKEADPHAWAIPRLPGRAKVALVEIEADEYGGGDASWMHSELFRRAMVGLGLDATLGAYVERLPGATLATVNVMSLFGLHRQRERTWREAGAFDATVLRGKRLGIVGYGAVGRELAAAARALGMEVWATKRSPLFLSAEPLDHLLPAAGLHELLSTSDVVVLCASLNRSTRHLIGTAELDAMKPTALLVNVARGGLVDENALVRALRDGGLRGAMLDVTAEEPLPPESPLWTAPNLFVTPHISGNTPESWRWEVEFVCANLRLYLEGSPERMGNLVDYSAVR